MTCSTSVWKVCEKFLNSTQNIPTNLSLRSNMTSPTTSEKGARQTWVQTAFINILLVCVVALVLALVVDHFQECNLYIYGHSTTLGSSFWYQHNTTMLKYLCQSLQWICFFSSPEAFPHSPFGQNRWAGTLWLPQCCHRELGKEKINVIFHRTPLPHSQLVNGAVG